MNRNYIVCLKRLLEEGGLSQVQLADQLNVSFAALNRWVNGHAKPRQKKIVAINQLFREVVGHPSISEKEISARIRETNSLKKKSLWNSLRHNKNILDELLLEHTYNSTSIEGTTFSRRETESVIFDKAIFPGKSLTEHLEVTNHATILRRILTKELIGTPLDEKVIKELHKGVMTGIREDAGHYSKYQRGIRGVPIALTHPKDIPEEMERLLKSWKGHRKVTVKEIAEFHVDFEFIHPFGDGNGRVGRLLMVLQCLKEGYPPVVIENSRKADYYDVLEYAQRKSAAPFILFLVEEMKKTQILIEKYL